MKRQHRSLPDLDARQGTDELQDLASSIGNRERFAIKALPIARNLVKSTIARFHLQSDFVDDATQEVALRAFVGAARICAADERSCRAWIRAIARHVLSDWARDRTRAQRIEAAWSGAYQVRRWPNESTRRREFSAYQVEARTDDPDEHAIAEESRQALAVAIGKLTDARRDTVVRRVIDEESFAEIAASHHVSESTARREAKAALSQLARNLTDVNASRDGTYERKAQKKPD